MREIKFRAWIDYGPGHTLMLPDRGDLVEFFDAASGSPIMQYTGLKDKNRKEIYEGDIVKHKVLDKDEDVILFGLAECVIQDNLIVVVFENGRFYPIGGWIKSALDALEYEIVGNIYEHPELMKGEGNGKIPKNPITF